MVPPLKSETYSSDLSFPDVHKRIKSQGRKNKGFVASQRVSKKRGRHGRLSLRVLLQTNLIRSDHASYYV